MTSIKEELTMANLSYNYKKLDTAELVSFEDLPHQSSPEDIKFGQLPASSSSERRSRTIIVILTMIALLLVLLSAFSLVRAAWLEKRATTTASVTSTDVPQYFQTSPEIFAGESILTNVIEQSNG